MNIRLATTLAITLAIAALIAGPVTGYAADGKSMKETIKENVKDSVITSKIKARYAKDREVSALNIGVETDAKGIVTLSGNAKSRAEASKAVKIARNTKGVTSVRNEIKVQAR